MTGSSKDLDLVTRGGILIDIMDWKAELDVLIVANRASCLWFLEEQFRPTTQDQAVRTLDYIIRYGDREAFMRASELKRWLLQTSNATSSG